jgi:hypothetical protein
MTATVGPEDNPGGLLDANRISDMGNSTMIWLGPTFTGGTDGLAQATRALESVPCVLEERNSDDQQVHTGVLIPSEDK